MRSLSVLSLLGLSLVGPGAAAADHPEAAIVTHEWNTGVALPRTVAAADLTGDGTADLVIASGGGRTREVSIVPGPASGRSDIHAYPSVSSSSCCNVGAVVGVGDHDLDGATDLVTSDAYGQTYVFLGRIEGDRSAARPDAVLFGLPNALAGADADLASDFDGDGSPDVVVGAPYGGDSYHGTVFVTAGPVSGHLRLGSVASHVFVGKAFAQLGAGTASVGDLTGDGIGDLAMASSGSPLDIGLVYLVEGGLAQGTYHPRDVAWASFRSTDAGSNLDVHDVVARDYDGDGIVDLLMADSVAPGVSGFTSGAAYGVLGPFAGEERLADAEVTWSTEESLTYFGSSLAAGDVDGDALLDVAFGAPYADDQDGAVYVQVGPVTGSVEALDLPTLRTRERDQLGSTLVMVPDWTGDGGDEIAVGAAWGGGSYYGSVLVFESDTMLFAHLASESR